eukprot:10983986-Karenia_brevis.AAC.1
MLELGGLGANSKPKQKKRRTSKRGDEEAGCGPQCPNGQENSIRPMAYGHGGYDDDDDHNGSDDDRHAADDDDDDDENDADDDPLI